MITQLQLFLPITCIPTVFNIVIFNITVFDDVKIICIILITLKKKFNLCYNFK